ncbi:MAG: peptidase M23 [Gemmatimonas sp.]|nr:peptidase M23 [Gemmatimonas sp.]
MSVRSIFAAVGLLAGSLGAQVVPTLDRSALEGILQRDAATAAGGVLRFSMPRNDLDVRVGGVSLRPNFALGSWAAFLPTPHGTMVMGDLVVLESELPNVLRALQEHGIEQSAIHHHLVGEQPSVLYVHLHAHGAAASIAQGLRAALAHTATPGRGVPSVAQPLRASIDSAALAMAMGRGAPVNAGVMQFAVPRSERLRSGGTELPVSMGVAHVINFQPTAPGRAAITGDFVLLADEVNRVIRALQAHGITPTSLHNHLLDDEPRLFFLHFWAEGDVSGLATGIVAALSETRR